MILFQIQFLRDGKWLCRAAARGRKRAEEVLDYYRRENIGTAFRLVEKARGVERVLDL
jgi:hypothetical protein